MSEIITIGLAIAKSVYQAPGVDEAATKSAKSSWHWACAARRPPRFDPHRALPAVQPAARVDRRGSSGPGRSACSTIRAWQHAPAAHG